MDPLSIIGAAGSLVSQVGGLVQQQTRGSRHAGRVTSIAGGDFKWVAAYYGASGDGLIVPGQPFPKTQYPNLTDRMRDANAAYWIANYNRQADVRAQAQAWLDANLAAVRAEVEGQSSAASGSSSRDAKRARLQAELGLVDPQAPGQDPKKEQGISRSLNFQMDPLMLVASGILIIVLVLLLK